MNVQLGYPELANLCGGTGIPKGRIIEIFGESDVGKSTIALKTIALAQAGGKICMYIDTEHRFDAEYARSLGVNIETLILQIPQQGTEAFTAINDFIANDSVDLIVLDSVAGLVPAENYTDYMAEWLSGQLYNLVRPLTISKACLICLNQLRINPVTREETSPAAKALGLSSVIRIKLEKHGRGNITARVLKNRVAPTAGNEVSFKLEE